MIDVNGDEGRKFGTWIRVKNDVGTGCLAKAVPPWWTRATASQLSRIHACDITMTKTDIYR